MAYDAPVADRRQFITWSAGGAFMLAAAGGVAADEPQLNTPLPGARVASPWFKITPENRMVVYSNAVEMGQGSHTGQATLIADEMDMPWDLVDVEMVDVKVYSNSIFTGGSGSIGNGARGAFNSARTAGAGARAQLVAAAAKRWNVDPATCKTAGGKVTGPANQSLTYGQLAAEAAALPVPAGVQPKLASERRIVGVPHQTKRVNAKVSGSMQYGMDVRLPGMVRASVRAAPVFGATLTSVDEAPALAIPGVKKVVKLPNAVAVIATDTWTAIKAVNALNPVWAMPATRSSSPAVRKALADKIAAKLAEEPSAAAAPLRAAFRDAPKKVEASYELAHVHHVTMEPQNCTVHVQADKVEIWGPTQVPGQVVSGVPRAINKPSIPVMLNTTMLGGGFGRRLSTDYVFQAAQIAAQYDAPVQVVWTREEDFTHDVYRRAVRQTYRAALRPDGLIDAYEALSASADAGVSDGSLGAAPYNAVKSVITGAGTVPTGIPQGAWRSVDQGISTWGRESFIDECAIAAGKSPLDYRLALLGDNERAKKVLSTAAEKINFTRARPKGTGVGLAVSIGFGSFTAHAIEVTMTGDKVKVNRIVVASDLGTVVAPNQVRAQFEGGALMALGTALTEGMTFTDGKADQQNFGQYNILRNKNAPKVEVYLIETANVAPGGAGEPPVPTLAPALANAIAAASGKRIRALPMVKEGITLA